MRPWDYHRDLTAERLIKIAQLLARGRSHALERYDPAIGDDSWTRGVCAFNYGRHEISKAAGSPGFEWLSVPDPRRHFQFRLGEVVMRFYRGEAETPKINMLHTTELEQFLLPLEEQVPLGGVKFRIAVETDWDGSILQVSFVAIRGTEPETIWAIPFEAAPPLVLEVPEDLTPAVEIEPVEIELLGDTDEDDQAEADDDASATR